MVHKVVVRHHLTLILRSPYVLIQDVFDVCALLSDFKLFIDVFIIVKSDVKGFIGIIVGIDHLLPLFSLFNRLFIFDHDLFLVNEDGGDVIINQKVRYTGHRITVSALLSFVIWVYVLATIWLLD